MTDKKAPSYIVNPGVKEHATKVQAACIDAVNENGSYRAGARALGKDYATVYRACQVAIAKAARAGYAPDHGLEKPLAPGLRLRGTSELVDGKTGERKLIWIKGERDKEASEQVVRDFVEWLAKDAGMSPCPATPAPLYPNADFLTVVPMGDPHFGMYAWAAEAGEDFDLSIAERLTCAAIDRLVASGPSSATALLLNLGDFFHADNTKNQTPNSGHALDVDSRHAKVQQVALRAMVYCIRRLLQKHAKVIVWCNRGNHDPETSYALALCLWAWFHDEPRVEIDLSPGLYKYLRFGKVLIGSHHGDGAKATELGPIMAFDRSIDWGLTQFRYWYVGHIHHKFVDKETPGVVTETFRTLAPRDAWHAGKGYRAGRDMYAIVHHREFGEVERHRCDAAMLLAPTYPATEKSDPDV